MLSHPSGDPAVLVIGRAQRSLERACLDLACRFSGFELLHCVDTTAAEATSNALMVAGRDLILVIVPADQAAGKEANFAAEIQTLATRRGAAVAITEITSENAAAIPLGFNAGQPVRASHAAAESALKVVAAEPAATGYELRDIRFDLGPGTHSQIELSTETIAHVLAVIDSGGGYIKPALLRVGGNQPVYLAARLSTEIAPQSGEDSRRHVPFGLLAPWFLLLRETGGRRSWQAAAACANLTIDDPSLVEPYGFVSFRALLAEMKRTPFHTTIGFVPWNYDRNSAAVAELFRANPAHFSLVIHGNNHEGYEFFRYEAKPGDSQRGAPYAKQVFNIRQAVGRIRLFEEKTGLPVDRVMVFPQAISPAPTLEVLRQAGFAATVNFSNVPLDASPPEDPAAALHSALTDWHDFPALRRSYPHEYPDEAVAVDLFLGNPVLFMTHQDDFSLGIQAFTAHAERVNRRQPAVRWSSLGEVSRNLHRVRWLNHNRCSVRMVSHHARITNPAPTASHFDVALPRSVIPAGIRVTLDGVEHHWDFQQNEIRLSFTLPPRGSSLVEVHEIPIQSGPVPTKRAGFRTRYLRMIADFRDLVVSRFAMGHHLSKWYYREVRRPASKTGRGRRRIALLWDRSPENPRLRAALLTELPPELRKHILVDSTARHIAARDKDSHLLVPHGFEANYVVGYARGLQANGVNFAMISSDETSDRLSAANIPQYKLRGGISPNRSIPQKLFDLVRYYVMLIGIVFRRRGRTIHFNGLLRDQIILFDGFVLPVWFRLWAGCYIHTAHNVLPHGKADRWLFRVMYRWIYRFPNHIVAHTPKIAEELVRDFGVNPDRISVISIGLNEEVPDTPLSREAVRAKFGVSADAPLIVFFGKVESYKGVDVLAEAWGKVQTPNSRLIVVGWCPDTAYAAKIRAAMTQSPRAASMEWREQFVPNEEVAMWLKACDAVVMPYRHIYQSGVVFLCLRFGVPIVATRVGSLTDFVDEDSGELADVNSPDGIAAAIDRFFVRRGNFRREEIASRAQRYSWASQCAAIKHLYP